MGSAFLQDIDDNINDKIPQNELIQEPVVNDILDIQENNKNDINLSKKIITMRKMTSISPRN